MGEQSALLDLTWDDLDAWAGGTIVARGRSYKGRVRDLRRTADGALVAWVDGSERYATRAWIDGKGDLQRACSCPYTWGPCKHAVAVILVYLDAMKAKQPIPEVESNDARLKIRAQAVKDFDEDEEDYEAGDEEGEEGYEAGDEDDEDGGEELELEEPKPGPATRSALARTPRRAASLKRFLESKTRDDLLALLLELADSYPEVRAALEDREEMQSGRPDRLLASIRKEIRKLTAQPAWRNDWTGEGSAPDYSRVEERLRALLDQGRADDVLSLGEDLLQRGTEQVGQSDDEGELAAAIGACMKIVFEAVPKSSLKPADQLLWIIDAFLQEDYGILEGCEAPWGGKRYAKKDWNEVAETLDKRLQSFPPPPEKEGSFSHDYRRQEVMRWLIDALEKAGRRSEIIPLLEREAPITRCYEQLVDRLLAAKRRDDARRWALDGYAKTIGKWPGIADGLRGRLRKMAENEKDWPAVAAWSAFTFFESPGLATYRDLEKAAKAADAWDAVRPAALRFLETGQEPGQAAGGDSTGWPLPPVDVKSPAPRFRREFPDINTLIDVAIHEKRTDDVLRWHEASRKRKTWFGPGHAKVAEAVKESHPDVSLRIWRDLAEQKIAVVQPAAYQEAAVHLRKMRAVYQKTNREAEWRSYLLALRAQHKAKRRLMQVLDSLEGKRIVES